MPSAGIHAHTIGFSQLITRAFRAPRSAQQENHMNRRNALNISAITALGLALSLTGAIAQQKQHALINAPAENSKYTQQQVVEVGDIPGHQVRVFEIHRTFPTNPPVINGLKLTETWTRGISDYIDNTGTSTNYTAYVFENGDKFFTRVGLVAQSVGPGKFTNSTAGTITGGTGKLLGIRGIVRSSGTAEPKAGVNENQTDIEYWIEK
jgi:hypothetical protein